MSSITSTVKRQNHRVHPCKRNNKDALLQFLLSSRSEQRVFILTANDPEPIKKLFSDENITVISDAALSESPELQCDLLISYDLPNSGDVYMSRLSRATKDALILLTGDEQQLLYPVETLLGRTLIQEVIAGFEPDFGVVAQAKEKVYKDKAPRRDNKRDERPSKDDKRPAKKPGFGNSKDFKKNTKPAEKPVSNRPARKITGKSFKQHKESK